MSDYTDKELLELAIKAAGLKCKWFKVKKFSDVTSGGKAVGKMHSGYIEVFGTHHKKPWSPLTDDGDALRLAVKLHLEIAPACYSQDCVDVYSKDDNPVSELFNDDPYAATRRAIVRAAAAIGEKL